MKSISTSKIFFAWLLMLLLIGTINTFLFCKNCNTVSYSTPSFSRFDSNWYASIAEHGYYFTPGERSNAVFFPLYPLAIWIFHFLTRIPIHWAGFIISIIFAFIAIRLFFALLRIDYPREKSMPIILVWILFPSSFFLISVYPTSLFVVLAMASFYFARKKNWKLAGLFVALGMLTRPYGIFLMPAVGLEYLLANNLDFKSLIRKFDWLFLLMPLFAILALVLYMNLKFGRPFLFYENQEYWGKVFVMPHKVLLGYIHEVFAKDIFSGEKIHFLINLGAIFYFIFAFILSIIHKVRWSYLVFPLLTFFMIIFSGNFVSAYRYLFEMFPVFIGSAIALSSRRIIFPAYLTISLFLLILLTTLFVSWIPIY